jgi:hypothetical protein
MVTDGKNGTNWEERRMDTTFVRVGDYFLNLDMVSWAQIISNEAHPNHRALRLASGLGGSPGQLTLEGKDAEEFITFLESYGHDLNPPAFKPLP